MPRIFLSYRRDDTRHQAGRVHDRLVTRFGVEQVFKDVDSIPLGWDFRAVLTEQVAACDVFLAIIGDRWLSVPGPTGSRRLDDPGDFVRIEVEAALSRNIPVIPVLVGDAPVPAAEVLPECLRELAFRNGIHVRPDPDFHKDMDRLIKGIELSLDAMRKRQVVAAEPVDLPKPPVPLQVDDSLIINSIGMKLKMIPAGEFMMGAADGEPEARDDEKPYHKVWITKPFYLGVYEVTQAEYKAVMGTNPSYFSANGDGKAKVRGMDTDRFPVETVSWLDAVVFCNKLSEREGLKLCYTAAGEPIASGTGYRLPTEAEWEYACRAGTTSPFSFGVTITPLHANFDGNHTYNGSKKGKCLERTACVGSYTPNAFGLYDMHGNVWEWCDDWYDEAYYAKAPTKDPKNLTQARNRVRRGGCWIRNPRGCRSANRFAYAPGKRYGILGFRVVRVWSDNS